MSDEGELGGRRGAPAGSTDDDLTSHWISAPVPRAGDPADRPAAPGAASPDFESPASAAPPDSRPDSPPDPSPVQADEHSGSRAGWERSLFEGDQGPGVPGYAPVMPSGPRTPPKPGTPSSGNLRLPDWMREEMSGARDGEDGGGRSGKPSKRGGFAPGGEEEDEGRTRLMLYFGIGLLLVALIAAGAVYILKKSSDDGVGPAPGAGGTKTAPAPLGPPNVRLPANKPLMRFPGRHDRAVGVVPDRLAGVAYPRLGPPWQIPGRKSGLGRVGWSGQQVVVTERNGARPKWYGQLLSGTLSEAQRNLYAGPGTERQAAVALAAQYDSRFYAFPHKTRDLASQPLTIDGRRGWLVASYVGYHQRGIKATAEVVAVAVVTTGRPSPAVVYMALPNTNRNLWPDFNYVFGSLRIAA
jgi:hypothetical protein